jgi:hypothetical protein
MERQSGRNKSIREKMGIGGVPIGSLICESSLNENYQIGSLVVGSSKHHEIISSEKQD